MRRAVLALAPFGALLAGTVSARSQQTFYYSLEEVFSTAVRFVRVDRGCSLSDRDPQAAYLVFECKDGQKVRRGALEMIKASDGVRAQVSLGDEPSYMEARFLDLLGRKLRDERGPGRPAPPPPRPAPPPAASPDGGAQR